MKETSPAALPACSIGSDFAIEPLSPAEATPPIIVSETPDARRGAAWVISGYGAGAFVRLAGNVLLSKPLDPKDFGLMALVTTLLVGLEMFSDIGVAPSIIQNQQGDDPLFLDTAWTLQLIRGASIWLIVCLFAWPMAWFYDQPVLAWIVPITGFTAVLSGASSTALHTARRHMQLKRLTLFELTVQLLGVTVSCLGAWQYQSVWALVAGGVIAAFYRCVASHFVFGNARNRLRWDPAMANTVFVFGRWVFVCSIASFLAGQSDRLILGKLAGESLLGFYSIAAGLAAQPMVFLAALAMSVMFPLLSKHSRQGKIPMDAALRPIREAMLTAGVGLVLGVFVESELLFKFLYDSRYGDCIPIASAMSITAWIGILSLTLDPVLVALGDTRGQALANVIRLVVTIPAVILGYHFGGLWGFIAGLWLGGVVGEIAFALRLRRHQVKILGQDLRYSGVVLLLMATIHGFQDPTSLVGIAVPQIVLALTLAFVVYRLRWLSERHRLETLAQV